MQKRFHKLCSLLVAILTLFISVFGLVSCESIIFGEKFGPYHYGSVVSIPDDAVVFGDKVYFCVDRVLYEAQSNKMVCVMLNGEHIDCVKAEVYEGYLYVCSQYTSPGLQVFSASFDQVYQISAHYVRSFLINDGKIYYFGRKKEASDYNLYRYDTDNDTTVLLREDFIDAFYTVDDRIMYCNFEGRLFWVDSVEGKNQEGKRLSCKTIGIAPSYKEFDKASFCFGAEQGYINIANGKICVTLNNSVFEYQFGAEGYLYSRIIINDGKLYFCVVEYESKDDCIFDFCICHVKSSTLFTFDLQTMALAAEKKLNAEEYFISYGTGYVSYYSDGKIYREEKLIANVETISPSGSYLQYGQSPSWTTVQYFSKFYDTGTTLYTSFLDMSNYMKSEYW